MAGIINQGSPAHKLHLECLETEKKQAEALAKKKGVRPAVPVETPKAPPARNPENDGQKSN